MRITRVFLLLWSCAASPAMSSAYGVEEVLEVSPSEVYLPKSLASCQAALTREYDFMMYLNGLKGSLESSPCDLAQNDEIQAFIKENLRKDPSSHALFLDCIIKAISCSEDNLHALIVNIQKVKSIRSWEDFQSRAEDDVKKYNSLLNGRIPQGITLRGVPCTAPNEMEKHNPINRLLAQVSIDYHSLRSMFVKESYQKMCSHDEGMARMYLKAIGAHTALGRYVQKETKEIPDPDTCLVQDGKMKAVSAAALLSASPGSSVSSARDKARLRLQQKLAQKKAQAGGAPAKPVVQKKRQNAPSRGVLSASAVAAIKSDVEIKAQEAAEREARKKDRALADLKRAQAIKEMLHEMRVAQELPPSTEMPQDAPSSRWTAPTPRVREKTRGVARPATALAAAPQMSSSSSSCHGAAPLRLTSAVIRRLEAFWEAKAGLTYHEVASLFTSLGGRIGEKSGGSSHVTLSYMAGDGTKLKHELWRPHGSGNTFGFRTMESLHRYFERCGLTLKD